MKSMTVVFEDVEHEKLLKKKKSMTMTWHDFIMTLLEGDKA